MQMPSPLTIDSLLGNTRCSLLEGSQGSVLFFKGCTVLQEFEGESKIYFPIFAFPGFLYTFQPKVCSKGKMDVLFVQI